MVYAIYLMVMCILRMIYLALPSLFIIATISITLEIYSRTKEAKRKVLATAITRTQHIRKVA